MGKCSNFKTVLRYDNFITYRLLHVDLQFATFHCIALETIVCSSIFTLVAYKTGNYPPVVVPKYESTYVAGVSCYSFVAKSSDVQEWFANQIHFMKLEKPVPSMS